MGLAKPFQTQSVYNTTILKPMETLIDKITNTIKSQLPSDKFFIEVSPYKGSFGNRYIAIMIAATTIDINNVRYQKPQMVSLSLDIDSMELNVQGYGGSGGGRIDRKPNLNDPSEKYLYCKGERISFRTPKPNEIKVLKAIETFTKNYVNALIEHKNVLMYQDIVNYDELLGYTM